MSETIQWVAAFSFAAWVAWYITAPLRHGIINGYREYRECREPQEAKVASIEKKENGFFALLGALIVLITVDVVTCLLVSFGNIIGLITILCCIFIAPLGIVMVLGHLVYAATLIEWAQY